MPDIRNWWARRREAFPEEVALATPTPDPEPWTEWDLPPISERDPLHYYGPDPDSQEAIEAARILNGRKLGQVTLSQDTESRQRDRKSDDDQGAALVMPLSTSRIRRRAGDEPPRMYLVRRQHNRANLIEMRAPDGEWTLDLHEAEVGQAHQTRVPEDNDQYTYESVPVDLLLWQAQRERADIEYEGALIHVE